MNYYNFGIDITRKFYPLSNDTAIQLPTQTPTIYVFTSLPSLDNARDGTGAQQTISSWTQNSSSPYDCSYTISAIDDPSPTSSTSQYTYFIAINFILQSSEQTQTVLESFIIERASGTESNYGVTYTDMCEVYPAASAYGSAAQFGSFISIAQSEIELKLGAKGIRVSEIQDPKLAKRAITYAAIQLLAESQIQSEGDKFVIRREIYKEKKKEMLEDTTLYIDTNKDGLPDSVTNAKNSYIITTR